MATGIQWCDEVWNPTTGCDKVSPGCGMPRFDGDDPGGCYAMAMAKRLKAMGQEKYQQDGDPRTSGPGFGVSVHPDALELPLRWQKPRRIFVNSMSDLFHDEVPDEFIVKAFAVMGATPRHTYQLLTKRHARMRSLLNSTDFKLAVIRTAQERDLHRMAPMWPLRNLWLGASVEDQHWADIRIPALLATPAAVRWLSCEPLLGPVNLRAIPYRGDVPYWLNVLDGRYRASEAYEWGTDFSFGLARLGRIGWVVAGGESGGGARPCDLEWLRSLRDQCASAGTAFFCKQLGRIRGRELGAGDHGGDFEAFPDDLKIREFPRAAEAVGA